MINDFHTHSKYSFDGKSTIEEMVKVAIKKGVKKLAITEHIDITKKERNFTIKKLVSSQEECKQLAEKYKGKIELLGGIEVGYNEKYETELSEIVSFLSPKYIINSVHDVDDIDCSKKEFYIGKTKDEAYTRYFETVLKSLDCKYPYHTVGHLGYIQRYAPYKNSSLFYTDYKGLIDEILKKIILLDRFLELNTKVKACPLPHMPAPDIVAVYKALGGNKIIYGSDAHSAREVGGN